MLRWWPNREQGWRLLYQAMVREGRRFIPNADNKAYEYFFQKMWRGKRCQVGKGKIEKRLSVMCLLSTWNGNVKDAALDIKAWVGEKKGLRFLHMHARAHSHAHTLGGDRAILVRTGTLYCLVQPNKEFWQVFIILYLFLLRYQTANGYRRHTRSDVSCR